MAAVVGAEIRLLILSIVPGDSIGEDKSRALDEMRD